MDVPLLDEPDRDAIAQYLRDGRFFWLDVAPEQVAGVADVLGLHPLAVEDSEKLGQRAKLDPYDDQALLVVHDAELTEVHVHVSGDFVLTVHRDGSPALDAAWQRVAAGVDSEIQVVHRIVDALADTYAPALNRIDAEVGAIEDVLLGRPGTGERQQLLRLRRLLLNMGQNAEGAADVLDVDARVMHRLPGLTGDAQAEFRDVHDHLVRAGRRIAGLRDRLDAALNLHMAAVTTRLTVVATIFLPLTVLTGFFGQNFGWLVDHIDTLEAFLVLGVGGFALSTAAILGFLRRSGTLGDG